MVSIRPKAIFDVIAKFKKFYLKRSDFIEKIKIDNKLYPRQLREISNPPQTLYLEGNINLFNNPIIAIIGSRKCTKNGRLLTQKFSYELSQLRSYNC